MGTGPIVKPVAHGPIKCNYWYLELVKISLIKSVETNSTDNFHSVRMPTIFTITIFDKFEKSLSIFLPICTV